jgi:hypothetical protein
MHLFPDVTAGNKEVLSGTDAVVISCKVTGLTNTASVKWEKSEGTAVKGTTGYTVVEGQLDIGTQTTTLTVAKAHTTADADYKCKITPAAPDDTTVIITTVSLNVFSKFVKRKHIMKSNFFLNRVLQRNSVQERRVLELEYCTSNR